MSSSTLFRKALWFPALFALMAVTAGAATFGTVVPIGGQTGDIALDEARGVLYIANFTANRIEVMSLADNTIRTSINVSPQPGALALSRNGRYLVVGHFGNWAPPAPAQNALTLIDLQTNAKQTLALGYPVLGAAFVSSNASDEGVALVVTSNEFLLFDPVSGAITALDTIQGLTSKTFPIAEKDTFPPQITAVAVAATPDYGTVYGVSDTFRFSYNVVGNHLQVLGYVSSPTLGPRAISVASDGKSYMSGWVLFDSRGRIRSQFQDAIGNLNRGSVAMDSDAGLIYAEVPTAKDKNDPPAIQILDADNLALREKLQLQEHLAGRSVFNATHEVVYAASDSGVTVLPVGRLKQARRVGATVEDLVFRVSACDRRTLVQTLTISDPGGNHTDFRLNVNTPGVSITPFAGVTPATVQVSIDPSVWQNQVGTLTGSIDISSVTAVNVPKSVRLLIGNRNPDQRGTVVNVSGNLVDLLADPLRNRFYILRQDTNEVYVYDGSTYQRVAVLKTFNTPTQLAITWDRRYLLIGHDNSQLARVYDLDTLAEDIPVEFELGHYPRSIAASGNALLAACRVAGPKHTIDRIEFASRRASALPTLGIFDNAVALNTTLMASPNGASIVAASADGTLMLYNASADTFTVRRKDFDALSGTLAASSFDQYVVDNMLFNSSLVASRKFDAASGSSSGFAFIDNYALRTVTPSLSAAGIVQRLDLQTTGIKPTRMAESPALPTKEFAFIRSLQPLYDRSALINLTVSGFSVLAWNFDAATAPPRVDSIVNTADFRQPVAPGGLVSIFGDNFSPVNIANREMPVPTALADSCMTVNGVPAPMLFVSTKQINAQIPVNVDGSATLVIRTPGGSSDNYNFTISPSAPSVFRSGTAGPETGIPTVYRAANSELVTPTNPIHPGDDIVIYATGLGRTNPPVDTGAPGPSEPLASALIAPDVTLGSVALQVNYAGLVPGEVGVYQINASVPKTAPLGMPVPLNISAGGNTTSLDVRVVK